MSICATLKLGEPLASDGLTLISPHRLPFSLFQVLYFRQNHSAGFRASKSGLKVCVVRARKELDSVFALLVSVTVWKTFPNPSGNSLPGSSSTSKDSWFVRFLDSFSASTSKNRRRTKDSCENRSKSPSLLSQRFSPPSLSCIDRMIPGRESETIWNLQIAFLEETSVLRWGVESRRRVDDWSSRLEVDSCFSLYQQQQIDNAISNRTSRLSDSWKIIGKTTEWSHYLLPGTSHQRTISIHLCYSCNDPNSQHGIELLPLPHSVLRLWINQGSLKEDLLTLWQSSTSSSSSSSKAFGEYNKSWNMSMSQTSTSTHLRSSTSPSFSIGIWSRQERARGRQFDGRTCWQIYGSGWVALCEDMEARDGKEW